MQIVIDIPKEMYKWVHDVNKIFNDYGTGDFIDLIKNGTPLPKGHGKIIDYGYVVDAIDDWINAEEYRYTNATDYLRKRVADTPTIIEADIPTMYYPQVEGITPTVISNNGSDMLSAEEIDNLLQALAKGESEEV